MTSSPDIELLDSLAGWYQRCSKSQGEDCANGLDVADWLWLTSSMHDITINSRSRKPDGVTSGQSNPGSDGLNSTDSGQNSSPQYTASQRQETESVKPANESNATSLSSDEDYSEPKTTSEPEPETFARLSTAALPNQRDVNESLQSYSDWLVASGGQPLRLHTPPLFPSALILLKPLNALLRQQLNRHHQQLDEERSAECSAAMGMVWPVYKPRRRPGLQVRLVLDAGMSMAVWHTLAKELRQVLASSQAFAQVSLESLPLETLEDLVVREERLRPTAVVATITILISDTAGIHWWDLSIQPWLDAVGRRQPMAVLHILPYRYRKASALSLGTSVALHSRRKLAANSTYHKSVVRLRDPWADEKDEPLATAPPIGAVVPVFSLDPKEAKPWAQLVMGVPQARCPGVVLTPAIPSPNTYAKKPQQKPTPHFLLQEFQKLASPEAQILMEWMAGSPAPLTLGVLRLLQGALNQQGNAAQPLAEVLVSGLLESLPGPERVVHEELQFQIIPDVRTLLLKNLDPTARQTVLHLVTQVLERHWNRNNSGPSFEALITDQSVDLPQEAKGLVNIANLTADMLDDLPGTKFNEIAAMLRTRQQHRQTGSELVNLAKESMIGSANFVTSDQTVTDHRVSHMEGIELPIYASTSVSEWCWPTAWDFRNYRNEKRQHFVGRQWLFEEVHRWAHVNDAKPGRSQCLLICADSGMGKTAFLAQLIDTNAAGLTLAAQHFCIAAQEETLSPSVFVRSIAAQLAKAVPAYLHALEQDQAKDLRHYLNDSYKNPFRAFDLAVLEPLLLIEAPPLSMLIVVDALDEAENLSFYWNPEGQITIAKLVSKFANRLPPWLKILVTSRPQPAVLAALRQSFTITNLNPENPLNIKDLQTYAKLRCESIPLADKITKTGFEVNEVASFLSSNEQSSGRFFVVSMMLKYLASGVILLASLKNLKALGSGLGGLYWHLFQHLFPTEHDYSPVRNILGVICEAREPISLSDLASILMRSAAEIASDLKPLHDFLRLQPVTAEHDGVLVKELLYSIGHPSLAQWLFEEDNNVNTKSTGRFKVNRNASAEIIQAWAMAELKAKRTHPSPYLMRHISSHVVGLPKDLFGLYPSSFTMSTDTGAIYISYTGRDPEGDAWAERVAEWCREWNYGYFRDKDHSNGIRAGEEWRSALYRFLGQAQAIVCLCSQQFESSPWCVGEVAIALSEGKTVIPILLAETEEQLQTQTMPMQLQDHQAIMVTGAAHPTPKQLAEVKLRLRATLQSKFKWRELLAWDAALPPYPGLPSFEERHAPVFFGRDAEIEGVLERLSSMAVRSSGFLLLLGASGCGKSSLVRAGVVPRLRGDCTRPWLVLSPFRPGLDPLIELRRAFTEAWALLKETSPPAERGESDEVALLRELQWLQVVSGGPVLLIIDQFEELLLEEQQPQADQFLRFIQTLLQTGPKSVLVLATLRIEFLVQMQSRWPKLAAFATTVTIEPIAQADFSELITGPASRSGLTLQPGLADRLVAESGGRDALALLAFTLEMLWRARMRRGGALKGLRGDRWDLTVDDYEAFGGVQGLVSNLAQNCWNSAVGSEADAAALRQAFLDHLVTLNEEGQAVKSVAQLQELPELSRPIVERMVNWRLLVSDAGRVEIAHEGLLRSWQPLVGWIEEGREEMLQRRRVRRLGEDLKVEAPQQRRQVLELLAALAAAGGSEGLAVQKEATVPLTQLLAAEGRPVAEREDAALVLALIGAEEPLRQCLADTTAPVALRRRAAESLGLLARRSSDLDQRQRLVMELESWLRSEALDVLIEIEFDPAKLEPAEIQVLVEETQRQVAEGMQQALQSGQLPSGIDESELQQISQMAFEDQHKQRLQQLEQQVWAEGKSSGWAEHDALLPLLQGASRGLQLAASADLPLFGSGPGLVVPMLTLTALEEGNALRIRTEVVVVPVWQLPLPAGEQLELVLVPAGEYTIGSPQAEAGRDVYSQIRQKCAGVDVEALQPVRLKQFALLRMPISQGQWRAVVEAVAVGERELEAAPGKATPESLWERHGQPGELAVDSVSWNDTQEWLRRLNRWLNEQWRELGGSGETPRLALPSENQWEAACRADAKPPTPFHFGATLDASWARYDASHTYGRGRKGPKGELAWPNGASGLVNYWGLGELHGQLLEWCGDLWNRDPWAAVQRSLDLFGTKHDAEAAPMADGPVDQSDTALRGTMESLYRLLRGGSWFDAPHGARAAFRSSNYPDYVISLVGLRPCCPSPPSALLGP